VLRCGVPDDVVVCACRYALCSVHLPRTGSLVLTTASLLQGEPALFSGYEVVFGGQFRSPTEEDLGLLVRAGGGESINADQLPSCSWTRDATNRAQPDVQPASMSSTASSFSSSAQQRSRQRVLLVSQESTSERDARELFLRTSLPPVHYHWILDSVSHYQVQEFTAYLVLPPDHSGSLQTQHSMVF
jgi:hypothetical protein